MRVVALDTHDGHCEGEEYDVSEHRARQLIAKGLVKAGKIPQNKMAPVADNKAHPTRAAGKARTASSLPAAPASLRTTARQSVNGTRRTTRGE